MHCHAATKWRQNGEASLKQNKCLCLSYLILPPAILPHPTSCKSTILPHANLLSNLLQSYLILPHANLLAPTELPRGFTLPRFTIFLVPKGIFTLTKPFTKYHGRSMVQSMLTHAYSCLLMPTLAYSCLLMLTHALNPTTCTGCWW